VSQFCADHDHAVAMTRLTADRFVRLVGPDGARGEAIDTGSGPDAGLWSCPACGSTRPQLPLPPAWGEG
jgi:hypothetical protein